MSDFGNETLKFPVTYDLKVILDGTIPESEHRSRISKILFELEIPFSQWSHRLSKVGRYISMTVSITVDSKEILYHLYEELNKLPGLKFAV